MLDITIYPECLECPCPAFRETGSETVMYPIEETVTNQFIRCKHECVCKRIKDSQIDFTPYVEDARKRLEKYDG